MVLLEGRVGSSLLKCKAGSSCAHQKEARDSGAKVFPRLMPCGQSGLFKTILFFKSLGTLNVLCSLGSEPSSLTETL